MELIAGELGDRHPAGDTAALRANAGSQFDASVVDALVAVAVRSRATQQP